MATTVAAPPPPPAEPVRMSAIGRIFGVFFSPKQTFEDIVRRPSWLAPMVVLILISIGLSVVLAKRTDWTEVSKDQIAKSKFAAQQFDQMPEDVKERAYQQAADRSRIIRYVRGFIGWPLLLLFASLIYWGLYSLVGGIRTGYGTAFAITAFAQLPMGLRELLAIPVNMVKDPSAIDPENFLASNPAALLPSNAPTWQMALLAPLDVFGLWAMVLIAIGFAAINPKKMAFGKSLGIAVGFLVLIDAFFTMIAWVFS